MKRKFFVTILVGLFLFLTVSDILSNTDILGWDKARWGMTHSQVSELYDLKDWEVKHKDSPKWMNICFKKTPINIQDREFRVWFFFDKESPDGKLIRVNLSSGAKGGDAYSFEKIAELLIGKYGAPDSDRTKKSNILGRAERTMLWFKKSGQLKCKIMILLTGHTQEAVCSLYYTSVAQ
jgi:hypothetical protein